jgi:uncharacterized phage-associated protein
MFSNADFGIYSMGRMNHFLRLPADAKAIANLMLDWATDELRPITPMKLHKLLYFCHADFLLQYKQSLLKQGFEAWDYGPVIPSVYTEFKSFRDKPITTRAAVFNPARAEKIIAKADIGDEATAIIYSLYRFYDQYDALKLSDLSHVSEGPWRHARSLFSNGLNMDRRISDDMIARFHSVSHS